MPDIERYLWEEGFEFYIDEYKKSKLPEIVRACMEEGCNELSDSPLGIEIRLTGPFDIRVREVFNCLRINHFYTYEDGIGTTVLESIEKFAINREYSTVEIWIGTRNGKENTKQFLEKNGYNYHEYYDDAQGLTFEGEKVL